MTRGRARSYRVTLGLIARCNGRALLRLQRAFDLIGDTWDTSDAECRAAVRAVRAVLAREVGPSDPLATRARRLARRRRLSTDERREVLIETSSEFALFAFARVIVDRSRRER